MSGVGSLPSILAVSRLPLAPAEDGLDVRPNRRPGLFPGGTWPFFVSQSQQGATLSIFQRVLLEPYFPGLNLEEVRIHRDAAADRAARSLGAQAFSLGRDIYFQAARFNPSSARGLALLGHEVEHVRQALNGERVGTGRAAGELEGRAEAVEASLLRPLTLWEGAQREEPSVGWKERGRAYSPLSLDHAQPMAYGTRRGGGGGSGDRSIPLSALSGEVSHPLKAEENRPVPTRAETAAASAAQDQEGLSRHFLRALEQKIVIEKERRGIDRWVP